MQNVPFRQACPLFWTRFALVALLSLCSIAVAAAQAPAQPAAKKTAKSSEAETDKNAAQIERIETKVRFEPNGDSRKEVHALVLINNELGARQFARLTFDYNRALQSVEVPLVRVTHANGGTSDVLPSAITDISNPAVGNATLYQDIRVKAVRILGLQAGDKLEYRVVTTSHATFAPDFWYEHTFERSTVASEQDFTLDVPAAMLEGVTATGDAHRIRMRVNERTPATATDKISDPARVVYSWKETPKSLNVSGDTQENEATPQPDVAVTTFAGWPALLDQISQRFLDAAKNTKDYVAPAGVKFPEGMTEDEATYTFVAQNIKTVDLPVGAMGWRLHSPAEIAKSGKATAEDKIVLLMAALPNARVRPVLVADDTNTQKVLPTPDAFDAVLAVLSKNGKETFLAPGAEVAPFGLVPSRLRERPAAILAGTNDKATETAWTTIPDKLPFASFQNVRIDGSLGADGTLSAKVRYALRGDNEMLLRSAFHQTPKEKWKDIAQLMALADGFRGKIVNVNASDPYDTVKPFTVDYEISQAKFVDWSKKPLMIPAILPLVSLPDLPSGAAAMAPGAKIDLGTPLKIELESKLKLPAGTTIRTPTGTSVERDYAAYSSQYGAEGTTVSATRKMNFISRDLPMTRAVDYSAFVRAVQNDENQRFVLEGTGAASKPTPAKPAENSAETKP